MAIYNLVNLCDSNEIKTKSFMKAYFNRHYFYYRFGFTAKLNEGFHTLPAPHMQCPLSSISHTRVIFVLQMMNPH